MSWDVVKTVLHADGSRKVEFCLDRSIGAVRYNVFNRIRFEGLPADEAWSLTSMSGLFETVEEAERTASRSIEWFHL